MTIDRPLQEQEVQLRQLWQEAFGDTEAFIDLFFRTGYAPERCRTVSENGQVLSALYWFPCGCREQRVAYIYALATFRSARGRGLAKKLMEDTHAHLKELGFAGCVLCPSEPGLVPYYETLGYKTFCGRSYVCCEAGEPVEVRCLTPEIYETVRAWMLPQGYVVQSGEQLTYLTGFNRLYVGTGFALTARREGDKLVVAEAFGEKIPMAGIVAALGCREGRFPVPGDAPFAMCRGLTEGFAQPTYFGLAFD